MNRPRRPVRPSVKDAIEGASDDWDYSSEEEHSDGEYGVEANEDWSGASTRSSVKCVASVVSKFDEKKRELVRAIGFGGILDLPQINKVSRSFTVWLLRNLDAESRTIVVNGEPQVDMVDFDVKSILGIPCGPRKVTGLVNDDPKIRKSFIQQLIGALPNETNSLVAAGRIVKKEYTGRMTKKQCDNFKVSFVVFVVGHLLAPTARNNIGNSSFWGALTVPDEIALYNWAEYVLEQLVEAAVKVQADIRNKKKISNITGCSILLQVIYLESLKIQGLERTKDVQPRIKAYNCTYLRTMIEADQANSSSGLRKRRWGSSLERHFQSKSEGKRSKSIDLVASLGPAGGFREELTEFATDNFPGKLTEGHVSALAAYGFRCATHFDTLKKNLMKESLTLVELLMDGSFGAAKMDMVHIGTSRSCDGEAGVCIKSKRPFEDFAENLNKGYESASEDPKYRRKTNSGPSNNILVGAAAVEKTTPVRSTSSTEQGDVVTTTQVPAVVHDACDIEPPSFDLGIDYQTQEKYMEARAKLDHGGQVGVELQNSNSTAKVLVEGNLLASSPVCAKRKSDEVSLAETPDHMVNTSTTSPASMSKLLAHAVVFAKIIKCQDELDVNVEPWDNDTIDSPVPKQPLEVCRLSKSPWFHGLKHNSCGATFAERIFGQVMAASEDDLDRPWIVHRVPRYLEVKGVYLKQTFAFEDGMSYDTFDLALRRIMQLDASMYKTCSDKRWRHIMESDFATLSQADEKPCHHKSIRVQFFGSGIDYKINRCRMLIVPANVLNTWCCYFLDFKKKCIHIVDPLYNDDKAEYYQKLHEPIADKVCADLANCIEMFFANWSVQWSEWCKEFVKPVVEAGHRNESGVLSLLAIREFDGEGFRNMTRDSYNAFRMVLLAEMLSLVGNEGSHPIKITPEDQPSIVVHTIDD